MENIAVIGAGRLGTVPAAALDAAAPLGPLAAEAIGDRAPEPAGAGAA